MTVFYKKIKLVRLSIIETYSFYQQLAKVGTIKKFIFLLLGVAFALVISLTTPHAHLFLTATLAMVFWTVFVQVREQRRLSQKRRHLQKDKTTTRESNDRTMEFKKNLRWDRNRVGIGLSYRPARLHWLAESIPCNRFLGSLKV